MSAGVAVGVMAHLRPGCAISTRAYPGEQRATLRLDGESGSGTDVILFADRAELVRLRDAVTMALSELDSTRAVMAGQSAGSAA